MQEVYKIFVTTPATHTNEIIAAISAAGAGKVGKYTHCAIISKVTGNYMPEKGANPFIGEVGQMKQEPEDKIEMICPLDKLEEVVVAIKAAHPYETPTIDAVRILFFN